ncbi:MAG: restriction endonuclease subunit S [Candidatus Paceibacterota bacterium]
MKIDTKQQLHILLSREHKKFQSDVVNAFKGLNVSFDCGLIRSSYGELPMQIILFLSGWAVSNIAWDILKLGIKKLYKKFIHISITIRDSESIMYAIKSDLTINVLVVPDRIKEFEHIKTIDDLVAHFKNKSKINISSDWQKTKLADIGVFSKGSGISKEELSGTGNNAVRYGELYTKFNFKINKIYSFIPNEAVPFAKKIKYGDILFAGSGETIDEIGKSAAYLLHEDCYAGGDLIIFSPKNANSLFLSYFLNIGEGRKKLRELGQGQSIVHIYKSDIENLMLHLPSLPEQNRIVVVLETWDKIIEKIEKKIEIKKQIKKGLTQDLLTSKKRLSGFNDKWIKTTLNDVMSSFSTGLNPRDNFKLGFGNNYYVTIKNISNGSLDFSNAEMVDDNALRLINKRSKLRKNDIVMSSIGNVGECYLLTEDPKGWDINESVFCLKPNTKIIDPWFIYFIITSLETKKYFENNITGSSFKSIKMKELRSMSLLIPGIQEQREITNILKIADKEISELEKKLSLIKDQKRYLLDNLITGKIRTPETLSIK